MTNYETEHFSKPIMVASDGDEVIFRLKSQAENFKMSKYEFDWLCGMFYKNWQNNKGKYHGVLKIWNEDLIETGYPNSISDIDDLNESLNYIEFSNTNLLTNKSLSILIEFLRRNRQKELEIIEI